MKKLSQLLQSVDVVEIIGNADVEVTDIVSDSRLAREGMMFVAVNGVNVDDHKYIPQLEGKGLSAIVCEQFPQSLDRNVTYIKVKNSAIALGKLASQWYGNPSYKLNLVGITGTNGKTTTATLIYEMARLMGYKAGLLSTVCNYVDDVAVPATHTTPDPLNLNKLLAQMVDAGCEYAVMEVSSHAAHQHRIAGLRFVGGAFSNLTRDHLDYHKTVDAYLEAKKMFFDMLPQEAFALTNIDDKVGEVMLQNTKASKKRYSLRSQADFMGRIIESRLDGTLITFNNHEVEVLFTGKFNAYNLTAVYAIAILLGWDPEQVLINMSRLVPVAGRFQAFHSPKGYTAIVDYAHTPDAVVNVLNAIRDVIGNNGNIITVVGAGGNRDKGKRPIMAKEAAARSQRVILTSDNPRDEEPADILRDMEAGLDDEGRAKTLSISDRREAIRTAATIAGSGDVILIAGKGHEDYQEIKGVKYHFDDREVVAEIIKTETK
ncbi:MAG: UDP-N-acetylmuramoyl-L-alanyl-D-glutamate--2,6-diaminopimelate ligase [Muribaculaceae bacterium]|nr:UDP-N-acetylmuramoyl-L-alanyl-D-glutamate--2,6-diaminopimelate ligase [Muribaculaceae bacterium]